MSSILKLCYHEASHALIARAMGRTVELVTVSPAGGLVREAETFAGDGSPEEIERSLVITLAGPIGATYAPELPLYVADPDSNGKEEHIYAGALLAPPHPEIEGARSDSEVVEHYRQRIGDEAIERARRLAHHLVSRKAAPGLGHLELVADELFLRGELTGDDLDALLEAS